MRNPETPRFRLSHASASAGSVVERVPPAPRNRQLISGLAREGQEHLTLVEKSIGAGDFDAASNGVRAVVRSCKACHEAYKPPE